MDINIYNDLDNFHYTVNLEQLEKENTSLKENVQELEEKLSKETEKAVQLEKLSNNLKINISKLFKTAKAEIERKDKMIASLRYRNDTFVFKRQQRYNLYHTNDENAKQFSENDEINENVTEYKNETWEKVEPENHIINKDIHNDLSDLKYSSIELNSVKIEKELDDVENSNNLDTKSFTFNNDYISRNSTEMSSRNSVMIKSEKEYDKCIYPKNENNRFDKYQRSDRKKSLSPYNRENKCLEDKRSNYHRNLSLDRRNPRRSRSISREKYLYQSNLKRRRDESHSSDTFSYSDSNQSKKNYIRPDRNHSSYKSISRSPVRNSKKYKNDRYETKLESRNKNHFDTKDKYNKSKHENIKRNNYKNHRIDNYKHSSIEHDKMTEFVNAKDSVKKANYIKTDDNSFNNKTDSNYNNENINIMLNNQTIRDTEYKSENLENAHSSNGITIENNFFINNKDNVDNKCIFKQESDDISYLKINQSLSILHTNNPSLSDQTDIKTEKEDTQILKKNEINNEHSLLYCNESFDKKSSQVILPDIVFSSKYSIKNDDNAIINENIKNIKSDINCENNSINQNNSESQTQIIIKENIYSKRTVNPNKIRITVRRNRNK